MPGASLRAEDARTTQAWFSSTGCMTGPSARGCTRRFRSPPVPFTGSPAKRMEGQRDYSRGEALTQVALVEQARQDVDEHGFRARKCKAGILEPEAENASIRTLRAAVADAPLRIDPNGAWQVHTKLRSRLDGLPDARKPCWRLGRRNVRLSGAGLDVEGASRQPPPLHQVAGPASGRSNPIQSTFRLPAAVPEANAQHATDRRRV